MRELETADWLIGPKLFRPKAYPAGASSKLCELISTENVKYTKVRQANPIKKYAANQTTEMIFYKYCQRHKSFKNTANFSTKYSYKYGIHISYVM